MLHPGGDGEGGGEAVIDNAIGYGHSRVLAVEFENLIGFMTVVRGQRFRPFGTGRSRCG